MLYVIYSFLFFYLSRYCSVFSECCNRRHIKKHSNELNKWPVLCLDDQSPELGAATRASMCSHTAQHRHKELFKHLAQACHQPACD